jgi:hypothetical protein
VSTPADRVGLEASQAAWAHSQQAPQYVAEDTRTHQDELMSSHEGRPTVAQQDRQNGAGLPAVDRGPL